MPSFHDPPSGGKAVIRSPLRLVHPAPPPTPKRRARHEGRVFTRDEQELLRATLRNLRARWGTWTALAAVLECSPDVLSKAADRRIQVSAAVVLRLCFVLRRAPQDLVEGLRAVPSPPSPKGGAA
jgi:hypothetical protein